MMKTLSNHAFSRILEDSLASYRAKPVDVQVAIDCDHAEMIGTYALDGEW